MNNFAASCLKALQQVVYPCESFGWNRRIGAGRLICAEFGEKRTLVSLLAGDRRFDKMQYRTKTACTVRIIYIRLLPVVNGYVSNMQFV